VNYFTNITLVSTNRVNGEVGGERRWLLKDTGAIRKMLDTMTKIMRKTLKNNDFSKRASQGEAGVTPEIPPPPPPCNPDSIIFPPANSAALAGTAGTATYCPYNVYPVFHIYHSEDF
jgi:hypothetical protein